MDCKEIKQNIVKRSGHNKTTHKQTPKHQANFLGHVIKREKLEHIVTTGMNEGKRCRGKQREKMLDGLRK